MSIRTTTANVRLPTGVVTFLLTDVVSSTATWERAPQAMDAALVRHDEIIAAAVRGRGVLMKARGEGDSTFSVFPRASDAAAAAVDAQAALSAEEWPAEAKLQVRMALHTGEAFERDGDYYGQVVNRAARLRAVAGAGEIVLSKATAALILDRLPHGSQLVLVGSQVLPDMPRPETVYRLVPGAGAPGVPREGVDAEAIPSEVTVPLPTRFTALPTFTGRTAELEQLRACAVEAAAGRTRVVLIDGEPGVGKTSLARVAARAAHADGFTVLYGRCDEDLAVPYQAFAEALGYYVEHGPGDVLAGHVLRHGSAVARLARHLADRVGAIPPVHTEDPEIERYLLFEAVVDLLGAAGDRRPLVVVLDDLQWADRDTLAMLRHLVWEPDQHLLVVGLFRGSDVGSEHPLNEVLAALQREAECVRIVLAGLAESDLVELLEAGAGHPLPSEGRRLARALWQETDGNPFFVQQIVRHLAESGLIGRQQDGAVVVHEGALGFDLPESVYEVVGQRLARLGDDVERVLGMAAIMGSEFDIALLAKSLAADEDDVLAALERAIHAALVTELPGALGRFTFAHALIGHTVDHRMSATRRARAHRRVAEAIEALYGTAPEGRLAELAGHWLAAGAPGDAGRSLEVARLAGDEALAHLASDEAVRWYGRALGVATTLEADNAARCDILIALGVAQRQAGDRQFRTTLLDAAQLADQIDDGERLVRAALANNRGDVSTAGEVDLDRIAILEAALVAVGYDDSPERARLLSTLALETVYAGDADRRVALTDEAMAIARRLEDPATLAQVLGDRSEAIRLPHTLPSRLASSAEHLILAERLGDPLQQGFAALRRARACWEAGAIAEVDRCMEMVTSLADLHPYLRWNALAQLPHRLLLDGHIAEAETKVYEAFAVAEADEQPDAAAVMAAQVVMVRWDQGRLSELEPLLRQAAVDNPGIPGFRGVLALALCEADRLDEAAEIFRADAADDFAALQYNTLWLAGMVLLAEVCSTIDDFEAAGALYERLQPWRDQIVFTGVSVFGSVAHYLGQLATTLGQHADAEGHFDAAAALYERMGATTFLARTRLSRAQLLLARDDAGDQEQAAELLVAVAATAEKSGLATLARRAETLLE